MTEHEIKPGNCDCKPRVGWDDIIYIEVEEGYELPYHPKCKRIVDYYDWWQKQIQGSKESGK